MCSFSSFLTLSLLKDPIEDDGAEGELVQPESDNDEEDEVLTIVDSSLSTSTLAREAANSVGASRVRTGTGTSSENTTTPALTGGRKRTRPTTEGTQPQKRQTTGECCTKF